MTDINKQNIPNF